MNTKFEKSINVNKKKDTNGDFININVMEYADIEYQIIANGKVFFNKDLDFSLLYIREDSNEKIVSRKSSDWNYKIERSTLGTRDNMMLVLIEDIKAAQSENTVKEESIFKKMKFFFEKGLIIEEKDTQNLLGQEFAGFSKITSYPLNRKYTHRGETKTADQSYEFKMIAILFFDNFNTVLVLGLLSENEKEVEEKLKLFCGEVEKAYRESHGRQKFIQNSIDYIRDESYKTYSHIMQSYKKMLTEEDIQDVHFFIFDTYDRRLYYQYEENFEIDQNTILAYKELCGNNRKRTMLAGNQIKYVMERIKKNIKQKLKYDHNRYDMYNDACRLFENLHDPDFIENYFLIPDKQEKERREWLLQKVLSCIPQEPWTGVAGHSAETRTIDISKYDDEKRWDPNKINNSYFYSKLVMYENLVGVGGKGSMVAFPILDCGQTSGVLFATRRQKIGKPPSSIEFKSETLSKLLEMSTALKYLVWFKRKFDFIDNVLNNLITDPDNIVNPSYIVGKFIPELINPALVVIWELNESNFHPQKPSYIFGYHKEKEEDDDGLIPPQYKHFKEDDNIYNIFFQESFEIVKYCEDMEILSQTEVNQILSPHFRKEYADRSLDGLASEKTLKDFSIGSNIKSGILKMYNWDKCKGWILIFTTESERTLRNHKHFLAQKLNMINRMIRFELFIKDLLDIKLTSTHDIRGGLITPINRNIEKCIELLTEEINQPESDKTSRKDLLLKVVNLLNYTSRYKIEMLYSLIAKIDGKTYREDSDYPKPINLIEVIKNVWNDFKTVWEFSSEEIHKEYLKHAKCIIIDYKSDEPLGNIENFEAFPDEIRNLGIYFSTVGLYSIIYNLIGNVYTFSTLSQKLLSKEPERANIFIGLRKLNKSFISLTIKDKGHGMTNEVVEWIRKLFDEVKKSKKKEQIKNPKTLKDYKNLKSNFKEDGLGKGLFKVVSNLYSTVEINYIDLITVESKVNLGTTFTLNFPVQIKEETDESFSKQKDINCRRQTRA